MTEPVSGWDAYQEGMRCSWVFPFLERRDARLRTLERRPTTPDPIPDPAFASAKGFDAPLIYGLLLASQLSRLIGQELPDQHAILTGISMNFISPAFADENLRFDAELVSKSDAAHALGFKCRITRDGKTLCRGTADAVWRA